MTDESRQRQLNLIWQHVTNTVKQRIMNRTLWEAMEISRPLTVEGTDLIVGVDPMKYSLASVMEQPTIRNTLEQLLTTTARTELHLKLIQGETLVEWNAIKERKRQAEEMAARPARAGVVGRGPEQASSAASWEEALSHAHRTFTQLPTRSIPQTRAQFILDILPVLAATEDRIRTADHQHEDDRGLGHVIDKIAQMVETDSTTIALEYLRYRNSRLTGPVGKAE
jgi:hypothetical protein